MTIKNDYCNKELCLVLEKKGIDASCVRQYEKGGSWYNKYTLYVTCEWLRYVYGLHVYTFRLGEKWYYEVQNFKEGYTYSKVGGYSHKEALEAAIWYCINNILNKE